MSNKSLVAALAAACALAAAADTLVFKSGSRLEGEVVRIAGDEVTFKSDDVGEVKVSADKLASIETKKSATVQYNDRSRRDGVVAMKDGKYTLNKEELDMGDVKAVNPEEEAWHGSVGFSGTAARGNTVSEKATVLAEEPPGGELRLLLRAERHQPLQQGKDRGPHRARRAGRLLLGDEGLFLRQRQVRARRHQQPAVPLPSRPRHGLPVA